MRLREIGRPNWAALALGVVALVGLALYATGRLEVHLRPGQQTHAHEDAAYGEGEAASRVKGDTAVLDGEAVSAAGITTAATTTGAVAVTVRLPGEVRPADERVAHVTPRVIGIVREVHRARGDRVAAGAPLLTLESPDLGESRAAYASAHTELQLAEANWTYWQERSAERFSPRLSGGAPGWVELDQAIADHDAAQSEKALAERNTARMRELHEHGLRSRTELLQGEAELDRATVKAAAAARRLTVFGTVARNEVTKARKRVEAAQTRVAAYGAADGTSAAAEASGVGTRLVIRSPLSGVVIERQVTVGETVEPTAKVFTVADLSEVWVVGAVHDREATTVRAGMASIVRIQGQEDAPLTGRVVQVGPQVDEKTRTLPVRIAVRNRSAAGGPDDWVLRPGMFTTIDLETERKAAAVVVPASAIQTLDGKDTVFVETPLNSGAAFERRPVRVGARDDRMAEVLEGLTAGERIVVANAYLLKSEFEKAKIGQGHAH